MRQQISTRRHVEYARGYLELSMLNEAAVELGRIPAEQRSELAVLEVRVDLEMERKNWSEVVASASTLCAAKPTGERSWIAWAYALRELQHVESARDVLLKAEPLHGKTSGVLHYNLACYYCLLGDLPEADRRLRRACAMDSAWREAAIDDPDLKAMRPRLQALD